MMIFARMMPLKFASRKSRVRLWIVCVRCQITLLNFFEIFADRVKNRLYIKVETSTSIYLCRYFLKVEDRRTCGQKAFRESCEKYDRWQTVNKLVWILQKKIGIRAMQLFIHRMNFFQQSKIEFTSAELKNRSKYLCYVLKKKKKKKMSRLPFMLVSGNLSSENSLWKLYESSGGTKTVNQKRRKETIGQRDTLRVNFNRRVIET